MDDGVRTAENMIALVRLLHELELKFNFFRENSLGEGSEYNLVY